MSLPPDIQMFLDQYPYAEDEPTWKANYDFYSNKFRCCPDELTIEEIHENWFGEHEVLEHKHGYIQWLFPIQEYGVNSESQVLMKHEIVAMASDPIIIQRIIRSYELMLDFYGMRLVSRETGFVDRCLPPRNYKSRYRNLVRSPHNNLRISRMLKSLSEFGLERLNGGFLLHVLNEQSEWGELNSRGIISSMDKWWANCIRNREERECIGDLIKKVRMAEDGYIFTQEDYKQLMLRRDTSEERFVDGA